ncbi:GntR family transcriptional regulator [Enterococcus sp. BWB1-3]|uniref:GntR family transcriptional regulator n=1 Tax=unclassified Enterococcus TaxID=2608891 RepID=UPI001923C81A|nr:MULTISPECIES: GntR family transcriptional regulator [unclassified Enterococcus]MBL1229686.1 GntR family transcriptional regulator [Enterococcus sp. BWB1-3]MCB5952820.1 GntR family transcriptional regulator [Enterococcus sp. BWT-B8]MCB5953825.1 GntR family transcriptional regulator [Enterococcus sp. CWB-B31]
MEEFIPKYKRVSNDIQHLAKILSNQGKPLPSERKLSESLNVSRTTVKRALEALERQGIVSYIEGKGFILQDRDVKVVSSMHISGFYDDIVSRKKKISSEVLQKNVIQADKELSTVLEIAEGDYVFNLLRLRSVDNMVYSLTESFIPLDRCPEIGSIDLTDKSLWKTLSQFGIQPQIVSQRVSARMANYTEIDYLNISKPAVVMVVNNLACWENKPIELSYVYTDVLSTNLEYRFTN